MTFHISCIIVVITRVRVSVITFPSTVCCQCLEDSTVYILSEVYKDRVAMARSLVRIFHALNKVRYNKYCMT